MSNTKPILVMSGRYTVDPEDLRCASVDLLEALEGMVDLAEYWINREARPGMSEHDYKLWLATGFRSKRYLAARTAIAKAKGEQP